jgi:hypothetical protein
MIEFTFAEVAKYYRVRLPRLKQRGPEWRGPCPIHQGTRDSFAVDPKSGRWNCHSTCGRGGDILALEEALVRVDFKTARAEVFRIVGRPETLNGNNGRRGSARGHVTATYDYTDEDGRLLYQAVRMDPKDFRQRQPDGKGGWVWNIGGVRLVLYHLPSLVRRSTETVFICEGEKDVHSLEALGLLATCNPMGAGKWRTEYSEAIRGRAVVLLPDNDPPTDDDGKPHYKGQKHAAWVAADLLRVGCEVRRHTPRVSEPPVKVRQIREPCFGGNHADWPVCFYKQHAGAPDSQPAQVITQVLPDMTYKQPVQGSR